MVFLTKANKTERNDHNHVVDNIVTQYPLQCHAKNSEERANNCNQSFGRFPRSSPTFAPTMICCFCIKIYAILEYHTCYSSISIFFSRKKKIPSQKNRSRLYRNTMIHYCRAVGVQMLIELHKVLYTYNKSGDKQWVEREKLRTNTLLYQ